MIHTYVSALPYFRDVQSDIGITLNVKAIQTQNASIKQMAAQLAPPAPSTASLAVNMTNPDESTGFVDRIAQTLDTPAKMIGAAGAAAAAAFVLAKYVFRVI